MFNLAMLAKQLWRIHCFPDRLLSKYLRHAIFLTATCLKHHLADALHILGGVLWQHKTSFERDADGEWAQEHQYAYGRILGSHATAFGLITPPLGHMSEMKVSDLIDPQTQDWNAQLIRSIFWPVDNDLILGIPLGHLGLEDQIVWHHTKNGIFSVRSAYHLARTLEERPCSSTSMTAESD
ncbi:hypothetical protein Sango_0358300 [Sesamum angolense]|uniref:Uncharacterized protein n=1 Tax=Sesamum angolense TaxID=2727404 RepID=A0AAE1XAC5_9LAMI|nr:hypothetical protein Sango_0358300 [Sesamum angolense]